MVGTEPLVPLDPLPLLESVLLSVLKLALERLRMSLRNEGAILQLCIVSEGKRLFTWSEDRASCAEGEVWLVPNCKYYLREVRRLHREEEGGTPTPCLGR